MIFGLLIGIYGFSAYGFIDWIAVIPFFVIGTVHMIYIYIKEIKPWYKSSKKSSPKI
ncbi:MAG: hypothetical protein ACFFAN_07270 [Promethearchaeota archaeon]